MKPLNDMTNEELWQLFPILLQPHDPAWMDWFLEEKARLEGTLEAEKIYRISHVGSTSVPGLVAKPTVDILLEIAPDYDLCALTSQLEAAGYLVNERKDSPPPHLMGMKGYTPAGFAQRVFHLHVRHPGDWPELYFRDYLTHHPAVAAEYAALKADLKEHFEHDRDAYTDAKGGFVRRWSYAAMASYPGRYSPEDSHPWS